MGEIIKIFADDILDDISSEITLDNRISGVKYALKTPERKNMTLAEIKLSVEGQNIKSNYTVNIGKPWYVDYAFKQSDVVLEKIYEEKDTNGNDVTVKPELAFSNEKWSNGNDSIEITGKGVDNISLNLQFDANDAENKKFREIKVKLSGDGLDVKETNVTVKGSGADNLFEMPCNLIKSGATINGEDLCKKEANDLIKNNRYGKQTINISVPVRYAGATGEILNKKAHLNAGELNLGDIVQVYKCRRAEFDVKKAEGQTVALNRFGSVKNFTVTKIESVYDGEYIKNLELKEVYDEQ